MSQKPPGSIDERTAQKRALLRAARARQVAGAHAPQSDARRDFLRHASAAGAIAGLPLVAAGSRADDGLAGNPRGVEAQRKARKKITLFFNLSHLHGANTDHFLYVAGRKYRLARVADAPQVLAAERKGNAFLRIVADDSITHHATDVDASSDTVSLAYLTCNENLATGTWEMTGMAFQFPPGAWAYAFRQARVLAGNGPLPASAKRKRYNAPAAKSAKDLQEEAQLIDPMSFAQAIVGLHPDILSADASSAAHIQNNYVSQSSITFKLGAEILPGMGPAVPEGMTGVSGNPPWATLKLLIDRDTKQPLKKSDGKLNQYYPDWDPTIEQFSGPALQEIHPQVRDDPTLGFDVTPFNLNSKSRPADAHLVGKLWGQHDGTATVIRSAPTATDAPTFTFTNQSAETGLVVSTPTFSKAPDRRQQITLDNVSNWFLRWLGVWVQFIDANQTTIAAKDLPPDTCPGAPGPYPRFVDKSDAIFLGVVPPAFTLLGIPIEPGAFSPLVNLPPQASSMRIFYTGLGLSGGPVSELGGVYEAGVLMTGAFNYGVVGFFMAVGSSNSSPVVKLAVSLGGGAVAQALSTFVAGFIDQKSFIAELSSFTMGFLKVLFHTASGKVLTAIAEAMAEGLVEAELIDAIPVAGQIARAVAAAVGAVQLAETSIEIDISPPAYVFDCVATHKLQVTFLPATGNAGFPSTQPGYTLYYRVSYLFDNGTAHTLDAVTLANPTKTSSIPVEFDGIPFGGQVNISIGLYMRKNSTPAGQNDWCAGYATTGLVPNDVNHVKPPPGLAGFPITEIKIPIRSTTRYVHTRKTMLADAQGTHAWQSDANGMHAPPYVPPPGANSPGLGGFESITVRQGTSKQAGYVGYSWTAYSKAVHGCGVSASGQYDQMANLNTDAGSAQSGYVNSETLCGFADNLRLGYNLLTHDSLNLYVDTTTLMIRQVNLNPPAFASPASNRSFGKLNNASARCLLHPSGHVVSVVDGADKLEMLKLPPALIDDATASTYFLARNFAGTGTQPGRLMSPVTLAIAPDGVILVLEDGTGTGNNRIQAFDLGGNPVPYFKKQPVPYFLELDTTAGYSYLDLAVEFSGYLYVLAVSNDGNNIHRLDIYHPTQSTTNPICTTPNVNAANLTVDFWRNVYTLNYEVLLLPNGNIPAFTEPSVSVWVPPPP